MIILLLALLGIALVITFVGWLLSSPKGHAPRQREYAGRNIVVHRGRDVSNVGRDSNVVRSNSVGRSTAAIRRNVPSTGRNTVAVRSGREMSAKLTSQVRAGRYSLEIRESIWERLAAAVPWETILRAHTRKNTPWLGIMFILLALFAFSILALHSLLLSPSLVFGFSSESAATATAAANTQAPPQLFPGVIGASKDLVRVNQLDPAQYASPQEFDKWSPSTCSAASMTEVINAYGHRYRVTDILKVEAGLGEISSDLGLLEPHGIDRTVAQFGFKTSWLSNSPLDKIIDIANSGRPIIVSFPPDRWNGGHLLVVRGGNSNQVYLADSSRLNMQVMNRDRFMHYWEGFAVAVVPN